ncbi:hypothetical protein Tco_0864538 [Tanacetum coccineum]
MLSGRVEVISIYMRCLTDESTWYRYTSHVKGIRRYGIVIQDMLSGRVEMSRDGIVRRMSQVKSLQFEHSTFLGLSAALGSPEEELAREEEIKGVEGPGKELAFPKVISSFHLKYPHP